VAVPVLVCKDILPNKDGSVGELLLLTTDTTLSYQQILTLYQKRWGIEDYHKSLKNNTSLQNSPARSVTNQTTHILASVCAFVKLEALKIAESSNQFALKGRLYVKAIQAALAELRVLQQNNLLPNISLA
jgi:transposase